MADIFDFEQWNEEVDTQVEYKNGVNSFNRQIQQMYFTENGKNTRNAYFSLEQAEQMLNEHFYFVNNKNYIIKYLTNQQWKSGRAFQFRNGLNLGDHVYNIDTEQELYGGDALDEDTLRIYGIIVEEVA